MLAIKWLPRGEMAPEESLWVAVVLAALADARSRTAGDATAHNRDRARHWLTTNSADLQFVLAMIGIDAGWWAAHAAPELVEQWANPAPSRRCRSAESYSAAGARMRERTAAKLLQPSDRVEPADPLSR